MKHGTRKPGGIASSYAKTGKRGDEIASTGTAGTRALTHAFLIAAVIGVAFVAYSNSFHAPFLLDNNEIILRDTRVHAVTSDHVRRILTQPYWEVVLAGLYRPFTTLSYLFNYAVMGNGADPAGYHWLNFILHAANIALVYALGMAIFGQIPAALILSSLWAVHPLLTEAITNIVGRADLLAAFGVLAGLLAYRMSLRRSGLRKAAWLAATAAAVTIGMFSKENAIVVVAVMALYDFAFEEGSAWRARIQGYLAAGLPIVAFLAARAYVLANSAYSPFAFTDNPIGGAGFWTGRLTAVKVIGRYLSLLVWPSKLSSDYSYNEIPLFSWRLSGWEDWKAVIALMVCLAAALAAIRAYRRNKPLFFSITFFFAALAPVSNIPMAIGTIMGERLLYLPSVGFFVAVVCGVLAIWRRVPVREAGYRYGAWAIGGVVLIALTSRTYERNADWLDQQRFWRSAAEAAPGSYKTQIGTAISAVLLTRRDWERSIRYAGRALEILEGVPDLRNAAEAYRDAGTLYRTVGDRIRLKDRNVPAQAGSDFWYQKSLDALLRCEKIEIAVDEMHRRENARRGKPGLTFMPAAIYLELGRTYMRMSETTKARDAFERGRMLEANPDILEDLATVYESLGEPRKAAAAAVEALAVDSTRGQLTTKLVQLYGQIDPGGCAVVRQGGADGLNVNCPLVHQDICAASKNVAATYARRRQMTEAASIRRIAVEELGCAAGLVE